MYAYYWKMSRAKLIGLASPYLEGNDLGVGHTLRVLKIAREKIGIPEEWILETEALIILHDIGGSSIADQYGVGPKIAGELLIQSGFSNDMIKRILINIGRHHSRLKDPCEAFKILFDSDQLVKLTKEEYPLYDLQGFDWGKLVDSLYHNHARDVARKMHEERINEVR